MIPAILNQLKSFIVSGERQVERYPAIGFAHHNVLGAPFFFGPMPHHRATSTNCNSDQSVIVVLTMNSNRARSQDRSMFRYFSRATKHPKQAATFVPSRKLANEIFCFLAGNFRLGQTLRCKRGLFLQHPKHKMARAYLAMAEFVGYVRGALKNLFGFA
jgi:hypothetical protein